MSLGVEAERQTEPRTNGVQVSPVSSVLGSYAPPIQASMVTRPPSLRLLFGPALVTVALAYYVGARVGFLLQSPLVPQSVLWLPNSILLAALIVSPPRRWPLFLLAAYPAHMLVAWQSHSPPLTMTLLFLTNCADATLGATIWTLLSPRQRAVEGLRPMVAFLALCATLPTLALSFADAGITVSRHWSSDYWLVFTTRARANVLTNIIFVPTAVAALTTPLSRLRDEARSRWPEAGSMLVALVVSAIFASAQPSDSVGGLAMLYVPLIFVVWSAVRFSLLMTGTTLLALALVMTWMAMYGHVGAVALQVANHVVPALQFELLAIAVPVLCLCAVNQDRERASQALAASQEALHQSVVQVRSLAGRLLRATEQERTRIARDLHDDINQQLAALGIGLSALKRHVPNDSPIREEVANLQRQAMQTADSVRSLSHELHPAALQHAGLVPALRELCAQYSRVESIRALLTVMDADIHVSPEVALCIYRVSQEALANAARHATARTAHLSLRRFGEILEVEIVDDGKGFDQATARRRGGLGLTSMTERVRLIGGTVQVDSSPGKGTRLLLRVPPGDSHVSADAPPRG